MSSRKSETPIDPVCAIHGLRKSEHVCLYCCLCFNTLTPDECWRDEQGQTWDMCVPCGEGEAAAAREGKWSMLTYHVKRDIKSREG